MVLAFAGGLTPAWVLALAALAGIVRPNDLVMRNALIGETIPPDHLMGALGMSRATMDSARVGGALAGAGLSTMLGIGLTYVFVTASTWRAWRSPSGCRAGAAGAGLRPPRLTLPAPRSRASGIGGGAS